MEFYLDQQKNLKFQLSSPDMSDDGKNALEGEFVLDLGDVSLAFPVEINENWVATIDVPKLNKILKTPKEQSAKASLCLHDNEYFFKVWSEEVDLVKGRPEIKAKAVGDKKKKKKKKKAVVEATMIEDEEPEEIKEPEEAETENEEILAEDSTPDFQKPTRGQRKENAPGLKSYLDHLSHE